MTTTLEALLTELTKEVRVNTESYIKLETTLKLELDGLRKDYRDVKDSLNIINRTQTNHSERLVASETRIEDLQQLRRDLTTLHGEHKTLFAQVEANAPVRTPWTAIVSACVALGALAWTLFGK